MEFHSKDVPKQIGSVDCGVFMLMYALCMALGEPFHFTASNMQRIRKWWCLTLMNSGLEKHGLRKTEEASHLLKANLEPLSRESHIMRDLCSAVCWIHKNHSLFRGEVTEPAVFQMEAEDQREALREVLEGQSDNRNDPFMFIFNNKEDMETLLSNCVDRMGLKIHAMFT
ncbi:structural maintenance of chromosomes protein 5-like isoform X1 [Paramormyrops kingsleyae]|uniref:structural maintenance of chromosomes protein 5-like isoform X1 n=1 Tax=Paramormyrops kingsleyae TaxID=1676925 RepID=UPI003B96F3F0